MRGASTSASLDGVVQTALIPLIEAAGDTGVIIELDLECNARVPVDEDCLQRAVLGLLHDALARMPADGLLQVSTRLGNAWAAVSVHDSGVSLSTAPGHPLHDACLAARVAPESRPALAVARSLLVDHGGRIEICQQEGPGTGLHVHLPLQT